MLRAGLQFTEVSAQFERRITIRSNRSLRSLGRAKARPLAYRYNLGVSNGITAVF